MNVSISNAVHTQMDHLSVGRYLKRIPQSERRTNTHVQQQLEINVECGSHTYNL